MKIEMVVIVLVEEEGEEVVVEGPILDHQSKGIILYP
jgi:hypothetical protein